MLNYKLNQAAAEDIEQLFEYGIDNFGVNVAQSYVEGLTFRFEEIAKEPLHYQAVAHIKAGYRHSVYRQHTIYFRISKHIEIMRILRRQNLITSLLD